jgi:PAS domain S-box-containing protein
VVPVDLQQLPVATVLIRDGVFFAHNGVFEELTGWTSAALVGKPVVDMLSALLSERDFAIVAHRIRTHPPDGPRGGGRLWCRLRTARGSEVPVRVEWRHDANGRDTLVTLVDAQPEAFGLEVTEALARAAGTLSGRLDEKDVLEQAVDVLCAHGFTATVLLLSDDDELLRYGPSRTPGTSSRGVEGLPRPPKGILTPDMTWAWGVGYLAATPNDSRSSECSPSMIVVPL